MYYPQTYHHIQEIQKYNIQDYRPRYVTIAFPLSRAPLMISIGWNNSKKQSAKCVKFSACENNVATLSLRQTSHKHAYYKPTTPLESVAATVKWRVQGRKKDETLYGLYDAWVFYCKLFLGEAGIRRQLARLCMVAELQKEESIGLWRIWRCWRLLNAMKF
jgi:hypothetical protein